MGPQDPKPTDQSDETTPPTQPGGSAEPSPVAKADQVPATPQSSGPAATSSEPASQPSTFGGPSVSGPGFAEPTVAAGEIPPPGVVVAGGPAMGGRKRRWLLPALIAVVLLVLLGGGYVFAFYLPNRPATVYATALTRTGDGLDALVRYSHDTSQKDYKSYALTGTFRSSGSTSFDGSLSGSADVNGNSSVKLGADILGEKISANFETVHVAGSATPDLYVQLAGIKKELDSFGLNSLDSLDGKWIAIDHTLISSYTAGLNQQASNLTKGSLLPTGAELNDAFGKVQTVNKQYIFTTDASKAVLANEKYLGKETKDGRDTYHYTVSYDKAHLKAYAGALGSALDSSSLNAWAKSQNDGKSLSQVLDIQSLKTSVERARAGYTFDLWIDAKTKLVHAVSFADPTQKGSVFTLSQNYTGGSTYPFTLSFTGKDPANGQHQTADLKLALNTHTNVSSGSFDVIEGSSDHWSGDFTLTPSTHNVQVTPPAGAEPLMNLLADFGLSGTDF